MNQSPLIFLVEDDPQLQDMYKRKLEHEQYSILIAGTGQEALELIKEHTPSIILLDVMLPDGMNGFDILERIKQMPDKKDIPVILFTNLSTEEHVAKDMGADAYLVKADTSLDEVVTTIQKLIQEKTKDK